MKLNWIDQARLIASNFILRVIHLLHRPPHDMWLHRVRWIADRLELLIFCIQLFSVLVNFDLCLNSWKFSEILFLRECFHPLRSIEIMFNFVSLGLFSMQRWETRGDSLHQSGAATSHHRPNVSTQPPRTHVPQEVFPFTTASFDCRSVRSMPPRTATQKFYFFLRRILSESHVFVNWFQLGSKAASESTFDQKLRSTVDQKLRSTVKYLRDIK